MPVLKCVQFSDRSLGPAGGELPAFRVHSIAHLERCALNVLVTLNVNYVAVFFLLTVESLLVTRVQALDFVTVHKN